MSDYIFIVPDSSSNSVLNLNSAASASAISSNNIENNASSSYTSSLSKFKQRSKSIVPHVADEDEETERIPTPSSELSFEGVKSFPPDKISQACESCKTNLFSYRHRILNLEQELAWQRHCLELLNNTSQRSKRDAMNIYSDMLKENHALKLGLNVPEHIAEIQQARVVSLIQGNAQHVATDSRLLELQERVRLLVSKNHREKSAYNAENKLLKQKVATLENTIATSTRSYELEIETLRCRLNRSRRGARVQELKRVANHARALGASANRLRSELTTLLEDGPLSKSNISDVMNQVHEVSIGHASAAQLQSQTSITALLSKASTQQPSSPSSLQLPPELLQLQVLQLKKEEESSSFKELSASLVNLLGGYDESPLLLEVSKELEEKRGTALRLPGYYTSPLVVKQKSSLFFPRKEEETTTKKEEEGDNNKNKEEDGKEQQNGDDLTVITTTSSPSSPIEEEAEQQQQQQQEEPSTPEASETEKLRSILYSTITSLADGVLELQHQISKEKRYASDLQRHLSSFKQQLLAAKAGQRPECQDAEAQCFVEDFEPSTPLDAEGLAALDDAEHYHISTGRHGHGRRSSRHRSSGGLSNATSARSSSQGGDGDGSGGRQQRRISQGRTSSTESSVSKSSVYSRVSSKGGRRNTSSRQQQQQQQSSRSSTTSARTQPYNRKKSSFASSSDQTNTSSGSPKQQKQQKATRTGSGSGNKLEKQDSRAFLSSDQHGTRRTSSTRFAKDFRTSSFISSVSSFGDAIVEGENSSSNYSTSNDINSSRRISTAISSSSSFSSPPSSSTHPATARSKTNNKNNVASSTSASSTARKPTKPKSVKPKTSKKRTKS